MPASHALIITTEGLDADALDAIGAFAESLRFSGTPGDPHPDALALGWTAQAAVSFALSMAADARSLVRLNVILEAAKNGGFIDRQSVYELSKFDAGRSLKGYTRPIRRHVAELKEAGLLPKDAAIPLTPVYDPNVASYQQATGFMIPAELVDLFSNLGPTSE